MELKPREYEGISGKARSFLGSLEPALGISVDYP
jgi:hypothetical protein